MGQQPHSEAWKKMVLRSMPAPAWLGPDAPSSDVVVSSRVRYARNVVGHKFPHMASNDEAREIEAKVVAACRHANGTMQPYRNLSEAERDFMLGARLVSPDFQHRSPGRTILLDESRTLSVMVNEEDHLRVQALTAGSSIESAHSAAESFIDRFEARQATMRSPEFGYLTASPANAGSAKRLSALFHMIGLAHTKRLKAVLEALAAWNITARGLFGESSRAVGAFFQVSSIDGELASFRGAIEYIVKEEHAARRGVTKKEVETRFGQAVTFAEASRELGLADALRCLAWARWAATFGLLDNAEGPRDVDYWVSAMEVHGTQDEKTASRHRAEFVRERLSGSTLRPQ